MNLHIRTKYNPTTWHPANPTTLTNGRLGWVRTSDQTIFEAWEVVEARAEVIQ